MFTSAHSNCRRRDCSPMCKHWRSSIIRACRAHGWPTPDAKMLLWEDMWLEFKQDFYPGGQWYFSHIFVAPPNWQSETSVSTPQDTIDSVEKQAEVYDALLLSAQAMYAELPNGWKVTYKEELDSSMHQGSSESLAQLVEQIATRLSVTLCQNGSRALVRSKSKPGPI
ncbi:hypothetical protein NMY22_g15681 [Coprinellus aureogranulatus]|nr:hypothetical protein NMY22_g15681 [Coprinellus aureogranulatus]